MAREQIYINPDNIRWARERAGCSLEEAKKDFKKIVEWEGGKSSPTYRQIERLSEKFKIPVAVFFFPNPPDVPPIDETFRTLPDVEFERIPRKVRLLLRKAKALQLNLSELCGGKNPSKRRAIDELSFSLKAEISETAREVRDYIGITLEEQMSWATTDDALKVWRDAFQKIGIFVFKDAFRESDYSGFCLYDAEFPIIYVNNTAAKSRQIFTLFHEFAHLLFQTSGIDTLSGAFVQNLRGDDRLIEIQCNKFAAEFLLPEKTFEEEITGREATEPTAELLAERYHVSREFIFRRFLDRGLIEEGAYLEAAQRWAGQRQRKPTGGDSYWNKIAYLGRDYIRLALSQYHQNKINEEQLAEYLDTKPKNVGTLEEYYARGEV